MIKLGNDYYINEKYILSCEKKSHELVIEYINGKVDRIEFDSQYELDNVLKELLKNGR